MIDYGMKACDLAVRQPDIRELAGQLQAEGASISVILNGFRWAAEICDREAKRRKNPADHRSYYRERGEAIREELARLEPHAEAA